MKLQPDKSNAPTINAHGPGWIEVNGEKHTQSVVVSSLDGVASWTWTPKHFNELSAQAFEELAQDGVELVLLGCGKKLQFPPASLLRPLISKGIGLESMDTLAACRTYNILASEGRKVFAALLIES
ncbi:Mth938-like domain-containing protein [Limnohabitans lacus]|uniref:Mth938-like domain-containing protein n=1 Tax=Limnohabitans lacus TaxID=3045173 RepID=A0ABT6X3D8_9BURK|nr:Mth938-like domain-containing protein [Limnohabitans sp. HM2-2]MDI9232630.1 Mth938-like domain-containing protein [Limnohabitans sp. HM2-2]